MAQQTIGIGTTANDGTGDPIRDAFDKCNDNFTELYTGAAVSSQSGTSYTAVLADANTYIRFSNAGSITFTIPPNGSVAFPVGTVIEMEQAGAGALTVAPGSGVTVNSRSADLTLAGQYAVAFVKKVATNTWTMNGDL